MTAPQPPLGARHPRTSQPDSCDALGGSRLGQVRGESCSVHYDTSLSRGLLTPSTQSKNVSGSSFIPFVKILAMSHKIVYNICNFSLYISINGNYVHTVNQSIFSLQYTILRKVKAKGKKVT